VQGTAKAVIAEFVGTFCFFFIGAGSIITWQGRAGDLIGVALAHGLVLAIMVTAFGHISGGHFNPAVSTGALVAGKLSPVNWVLYIIAQLLGGVLAGFALRTIFPESVWQPVHLGTPAVAEGVSFGTAVLVEAILTFILVTTVFGTAIDPRAAKVGGFAIGMAVAVDILMGGPLTGASMNPARTFGPAVAAGFWDNHLVYWIGPLIGGTVAGALYGYFFLERKQ